MADDLPATVTGQALQPAIEWVPLGTLTVYHITEQELDLLENGTPESTYFNFGISLLSAGVSFLTSLLTTDIKSQRLFTVFVVLAVVGIIGGAMLLLVWWRSERSYKKIVRTIRSRKLPKGG